MRMPEQSIHISNTDFRAQMYMHFKKNVQKKHFLTQNSH